MAKPGHPVLQHVVDRVTTKLATDMRMMDNVTSHDLLYVQDTTGPRVGFASTAIAGFTVDLDPRNFH